MYDINYLILANDEMCIPCLPILLVFLPAVILEFDSPSLFSPHMMKHQTLPIHCIY